VCFESFIEVSLALTKWEFLGYVAIAMLRALFSREESRPLVKPNSTPSSEILPLPGIQVHAM
jgi:hypothetical protein